MTPDQFRAATEDALAQVDRLTTEGIARAQALLKQVQDDLVLKLAAAPTEYGEWYYNQLLADTQRLSQVFERQAAAALEYTLDQAAEIVPQAVDEPLQRAGLTLALPRVNRRSVEFLSRYSPGELIGGLAQAARERVRNELRLGLIGAKSAYDVQKSLAARLDAPGPFGTIARRAEAIWRTEANRGFNLLTQQRYARIEAQQPGKLKKRWLHSGNARNPRPHHIALGQNDPIGLTEDFLVGGYPAAGPHDARLPAKEVVNCGCSTITVF